MKGRNNVLIAAAIKAGMRLENGQLILASGKPYKGTAGRDGYHIVTLKRDGKNVNINRARVILWLTQGPPPTNRHEADHINGVRGDDRPENLRWATPSENVFNVSDSEQQRRVSAMKARHDEVKRLKASHDALVADLADEKKVNAGLVAALELVALTIDAHDGESCPKWILGMRAQARAALAEAKGGAS